MKKLTLLAIFAMFVSPVFAATVGSPLDSENHSAFDGVTEILDAVAVPADSPIASGLVKNNGNVKVATIFLVEKSDGSEQLIFQATDGTTKTRVNIGGSRNADFCGFDSRNAAGGFIPDGAKARFSDDGGLLVSEYMIREKGNNTPYLKCVAVWTVEPDGNSGGEAKGVKILCMESFVEVQALRTDEGLAGQYLIDGLDLDGDPVTFVVER